MGTTKTEHYTPAQNKIAAIAKALGHPARIAIIEHLMKINECICGDIVNELPLSQATVSQHLKELKNAGIIRGNIEGTSVCYCLEEEAFKIITQYLNKVTNLIQEQKCC